MTKAEERRRRILTFFEWLKEQDTQASRDSLLGAYSFKTGIAVRTIREYYDVLESVKAIQMERVEKQSTRRDGSTYSYYRWKRVLSPGVIAD